MAARLVFLSRWNFLRRVVNLRAQATVEYILMLLIGVGLVLVAKKTLVPRFNQLSKSAITQVEINFVQSLKHFRIGH
jgi:hypothetical protein